MNEATGHDYRRVEGPDGRMRMECKCGKRSRWSETYAPVLAAQDRHADEVARKANGGW